MSSFDTARDLRLPGVRLERAYIDPTAIGTRMRNMPKKMLRQGYTEGGWSSKSKQLAAKISDCYDLRVIDRNSYGFRVPERASYSDADAKVMLELIDAAEAIELMNVKPHSMSEREKEYIKDRMDTARTVIAGRGYVRHRWVTIYNGSLVDQICATLAKTRSHTVLEATEDICKKLDDGLAIDITLSY